MFVCACVGVFVSERASVRASVRACVRACVCIPGLESQIGTTSMHALKFRNSRTYVLKTSASNRFFLLN